MKKIISYFFVILGLSTNVLADENFNTYPSADDGTLKIAVQCSKQYPLGSQVSPSELRGFSFNIYIKNIGRKTVSVFTENPLFGFDFNRTNRISIIFSLEEIEEGIFIKPSASKMGLVTLKPGEVTKLQRAQCTLPIDKRVGNFYITYEIEKDFGKMMSVWFGKIEVVVPNFENRAGRRGQGEDAPN